MDYDTTISMRLDPELAKRFGEFRLRYSINVSEFLRRALVDRMDKWPEMAATEPPLPVKLPEPLKTAGGQ